VRHALALDTLESISVRSSIRDAGWNDGWSGNQTPRDRPLGPRLGGPNSDRDTSPIAAAAEGEDRGRQASSASEIPAKGWKDILLRVYANISKHRVLALAAGMTYYSILAIFPAIAAFVAMYGLFSDPATIVSHLDQIGGFLPGGAIDVAKEQLTRVAANGTQTLGVTFVIGLATSLWSANSAMKSLFDTLNIVHGEEEKRGFLKLNAISLGFTVGGVLFIVVALGSIVVVPVILNYVACPTPVSTFFGSADGPRCS
jgi:membrane protein